MTKEGVKTLFKTLCVFYPRTYGYKDDDTAIVWLEDFTHAFAKYEDGDVSQALRNWRKEHSDAPQVADLLREVKIIVMDKRPADTMPESSGESVPNPHGRAVREMLAARIKMADPANDPHDFAWYAEHYPERPGIDKPMYMDEIKQMFGGKK